RLLLPLTLPLFTYTTLFRSEKKVSKGDAEKAYKSAVPKKISHDDLMAKTTAYWSHVKASGTDIQYVPYPGKWLRAEQWDDDLGRSEEHTSELKSRFDVVCRL